MAAEAGVTDRTSTKEPTTEKDKTSKTLIDDVNAQLKKEGSTTGNDAGADKVGAELEQRQILPKLVVAEFSGENATKFATGNGSATGRDVDLQKVRDLAEGRGEGTPAERLAALFVLAHADAFDKDHSGTVSAAELQEWAKNNNGQIDTLKANKDGSIVIPGPNGKPTEVMYPDGARTQFDYDKTTGQLTGIKTSDGENLLRVGDKWYSSRANYEVSNVTVNDDGSFSYKRGDAKFVHETNDTISKRDNYDNPTEVYSPDGKKTSITYNTPQDHIPSSYTLPDGKTFQRNGTTWTDANGKPIDNVALSADGLRFDREGSHVLHKQDGAEVVSDQQNRVTGVYFKDGSSRTFRYDGDTINGITETDSKGKKNEYKIENGKWVGPGANAAAAPEVDRDGTYRFKNEDGSTTVRKTDQSELTVRDGNVTDVRYANGKSTHFDYDQNHHVIRIQENDGKNTVTFEAENGKWDGRFLQNGIDTGNSKPVVQPDGTYSFVLTTDGVRTTRLTDGNEYRKQSDSAQSGAPALDNSALAQSARAIHDGLSATTFFISSPEAQKIFNVLEPMSAQDRAQLEQYYQKAYGTELRLDLAKHLNQEQYAQVDGILNRKDGGADDITQVETALLRLETVTRTQEVLRNPIYLAGGGGDGGAGAALGQAFLQSRMDGDRKAAEKDIRDTLAILSPTQFNELEKQYSLKHPGHTLAEDLKNNSNISEETRKAVDILTHKSSSTLNEKEITALSEIAINAKNADIFNEAWRNATPEVRARFSTPENLKRIEQAFGDRAQISKDYLESGHIKLDTLVRGDTHWWHTDKESITSALNSASEEDRQKYLRGYELANGIGDRAAKPGDDDAKRFYKDLHDALNGAKNSDRELAVWEAQLTRKGGLIAALGQTHDDGFKIPLTDWHVGGGHDFNNVIRTIENMSGDDWAKLNDPVYAAQLDKTLKTFLSGDEYDKAHRLIEAKSKASLFEESKKLDHRVVLEGADPTLPNFSTGAVEALVGMSADDRKRYLSDESYRKRFDAEIDKISGNEKVVALRLMEQIKAGKAAEVDPVTKVILDTYGRFTNDRVVRSDAHDTIIDIENAFKADPTLRERLKNAAPGSEDAKLREYFDYALKFSIDGSIAPGFAPDRYTLYHYQLFEKGRVELTEKMRLTLDTMDGPLRPGRLQLYKDIMSASPEERALLLGNDGKSKNYQDQIFRMYGDFSNAEKQLIKTGLQQDGKFKSEDLVRMQVVSGGKFEDYAAIFNGKAWNSLSDREKASIADTYKQKYGSNFKDDVLSKVDGDARAIMSNVINQGGFRTEDIVRAYVTGTGKFSEKDVHDALSGPFMTNPVKEQFKNEYARKYGSDANNDILSKIPGEKRVDYLHLLTPTTRNPRQDVYEERRQYEQHKSEIGDWLLSKGWNYSKEQASGALDSLYGFVQRHADEIDKLPTEKREEFKKLIENYDEAQRRYIESKGQFAEEFANTTLMLAAAGGTLFTGGTSWELYMTVAAVGGAYKVGTKALINGTDSKLDPFNLSRDLITGGSLAAVSFMGPEICGQILGVGESAAGMTAQRVLASKATANLIKGELTEEAIKSELSTIARNALISGGKGAEERAATAMRELAAKYAVPGKEAELAEILSKTFNTALADASKNFLVNAIREYGLIAAAGGTGGAVTGFEEAAFDGRPDQFVSRTLGGFLEGSISALALAPIFKGAVKLVEHGSGFLAGKRVAEVEMGGKKYQSADGVNWSAAEGDRFSGVLVRGPNGEVKFKTNRGEITRASDGSFVEKEGPITRSYDTNGRVKQLSDTQGKNWSYEYDATGNLTKVEITENGVVKARHSTTDGQTWQHERYGQTVTNDRPVRVGRDGSIETIEDLQTKLIERPDGIKILKEVRTGAEKVLKPTADEIKILRGELEGQLTPIKNAEHFDRVNKWMDALEQRARKGEITDEQLATTYYHINRLLSTDNALVPRETRMLLAEQILADSARYDLPDQGQHLSCALTATQKMMLANDPGAYARTMTDAVLTGKVTLANGTVLDLSDPRMGVFSPDYEARSSINRPFDKAAGNYPKDLRVDGDRNFAGQIYQSIIANLDLSMKTEIHLGDGKVITGVKPGDIRYVVDSKATYPAPQEYLMDFRTNPPSRITNAKGEVVNGPNMNGQTNYQELMRQLGYEGRPTHVLQGPLYGGGPGRTSVGDAVQLRTQLEAWQANGELPIIAMVDGKNKILYGIFGGPATTEPNHTVLITKIDAQGVHVTNSWGSQHEYIIPVDEFFKALP